MMAVLVTIKEKIAFCSCANINESSSDKGQGWTKAGRVTGGGRCGERVASPGRTDHGKSVTVKKPALRILGWKTAPHGCSRKASKTKFQKSSGKASD